jgi:hypothetical protein
MFAPRYRLTVDSHDRGVVTLDQLRAMPGFVALADGEFDRLRRELDRWGATSGVIFRRNAASIDWRLQTAIPPAETLPDQPKPQQRRKALARFLIDRAGDPDAAITRDDLERAGFTPREIDRHLAPARALAIRAAGMAERGHRGAGLRAA